MLWDCPAYASVRSAFMSELRRELGDRFEHFQSLDSFEKSSYVLGSEAWEDYSSGLLGFLCLVYGRKGRLGYMANMLTFTGLILRMTLGSSGCMVNGYGCLLSYYYAQCCHGDGCGVRHVHMLYYQATVLDSYLLPEAIKHLLLPWRW